MEEEWVICHLANLRTQEHSVPIRPSLVRISKDKAKDRDRDRTLDRALEVSRGVL